MLNTHTHNTRVAICRVAHLSCRPQEFIKDRISADFKSHGLGSNVRYIDPSYMIRSVPANAADALYCMMLAQNAVHGSMAGLTAFTTGLHNNRMVFLPIPRVVATSPRVMDAKGRTWERVLANTGQPQPQPQPQPAAVAVI